MEGSSKFDIKQIVPFSFSSEATYSIYIIRCVIIRGGFEPI